MARTDRRCIGYLNFYDEMLELLNQMKTNYAEMYERYQKMTMGWVKEARYVTIDPLLPFMSDEF